MKEGRKVKEGGGRIKMKEGEEGRKEERCRKEGR